MNDIQASKYLGWFSLGLGAFELLASRRISRKFGLGSARLVQALGAREVAAGLMVLNKPDTALPMWSRVAGDALDAGVLLTALGSGNRRRGNAAGALLFVAATAVLDVAVASSLSRREGRALRTARRTRVKRVPKPV